MHSHLYCAHRQEEAYEVSSVHTVQTHRKWEANKLDLIQECQEWRLWKHFSFLNMVKSCCQPVKKPWWMSAQPDLHPPQTFPWNAQCDIRGRIQKFPAWCTKWKMLQGIYSAIYGEVNVSVLGGYVLQYAGGTRAISCFISVTLKSWPGRKILDPTTYVRCYSPWSPTGPLTPFSPLISIIK
jgi:hypothetical protein